MSSKQVHIWVVLQCLLLFGCVTSGSVSDAPRQGVTQITDHITDSGAAYTLALMPDADQVSIHIAWPNDWAHANDLAVASSVGVSLMSSGGAGDRSAKNIAKDIVALGSSASLVASPDHIYATFTANVADLEETLDIVSDVIAQPELSKQQFLEIRTALEERVEIRQLKPSARLWGVARKSLLGEASLTNYWNNLPIESVVSPLTIENINRWHKETFTRQGINIAVAGPLESAAVGIAIDTLLASLPSKPSEKSEQNPVSPRVGHTVLLHDETISTTLIAVIGLLPASRESGEVSDVVAVSALGKGKESRIFKAQKQQLPDVREINTSIANFSREIRVFGISTETNDTNVADVLKLIEETYTQFKLADLDDQEVLRAAVPFANTLKATAQKVDVVAYGVGQLLIDGLPKELLMSVMQDTLTLRADDINKRIAERYPAWDSMLKVVMSSDAEIVEADCVVTQLEELERCGF